MLRVRKQPGGQRGPAAGEERMSCECGEVRRLDRQLFFLCSGAEVMVGRCFGFL